MDDAVLNTAICELIRDARSMEEGRFVFLEKDIVDDFVNLIARHTVDKEMEVISNLRNVLS